MKIKLENLYKHYTVYNEYMKVNIEEVISDVLNNNTDINPIIITININNVVGVLDCIITNLELDYSDDKLRVIIYEVLIDMYLYTKKELGNVNDFTRAGVTVDVDLQNNKLLSNYIRDSKVLIDYSNEYIKALTHFYMVHDELLNGIESSDDSDIVYVGMTSKHIANILII